MPKTKHFLNVVFLVVFAAFSIVPLHAQEAILPEEVAPSPSPAVVPDAVMQEDIVQPAQLEPSLPLVSPEAVISVDSDFTLNVPDTESENIGQETSTVSQAATSTPSSLLTRTLASSSLNSDLPFELTSADMVFAINEIPSFSFTSKSLMASTTESDGFVSDIVESIVETITDVYTGSVVETIVDTVTETFETVIDFILPSAEAEENTVEDEVVNKTADEEALTPVIESSNSELIPEENEKEQVEIIEVPPLTPSVLPDAVPEETTTDVVVVGDIEDISISLVPTFATSSEDGVEIVSVAPPTVLEPFAIVDGIRLPVEVTVRDTRVFDVSFIEGVFDVGEHALELHIIFEGEEYIGYYIFTIEGTVVSLMPLTATTFAVVVADEFLFQTLWLQEMASGSVHSYEKIGDETTFAKNPILEFKDGILLFSNAQSDALIGFDIVSKSSFSQTLNTNSSEDNLIKLNTGQYDVQVESTYIQLEFIPEQNRI